MSKTQKGCAGGSRRSRRNELIAKLESCGLELRGDSSLCKKYIECGDEDIDYVVERMCQMKYIHEYVDFDKYHDIAYQEQKDLLRSGFYPDCSVFDEAEDMVMKEIGGYPTVYPWLDVAEEHARTRKDNKRKAILDAAKEELMIKISADLKKTLGESRGIDRVLLD